MQAKIASPMNLLTFELGRNFDYKTDTKINHLFHLWKQRKINKRRRRLNCPHSPFQLVWFVKVSPERRHTYACPDRPLCAGMGEAVLTPPYKEASPQTRFPRTPPGDSRPAVWEWVRRGRESVHLVIKHATQDHWVRFDINIPSQQT